MLALQLLDGASRTILAISDECHGWRVALSMETTFSSYRVRLRPILLAEDSEDDALIIKSTLGKAGVLNPVFVVPDGVKAIAYLKGEGEFAVRGLFPVPDVFLLDLKMPRKDGFDVLQWW